MGSPSNMISSYYNSRNNIVRIDRSAPSSTSIHSRLSGYADDQERPTLHYNDWSGDRSTIEIDGGRSTTNPSNQASRFGEGSSNQPNDRSRDKSDDCNASDRPRGAYSDITSDKPYDKPGEKSTDQHDQRDKPSSSSASASSKIPKKITNPSDKYDDMGMLTLIDKYREAEADNEKTFLRRARIEKDLADMTRNAHGANIEHNPLFKKYKDDQRKCDEEGKEHKAKMSKISEKLSSKYNHRIEPKKKPTIIVGASKSLFSAKPTASVRKEAPKRARMSTTTSQNDSADLNNRSKLKFKLNEDKIWCRACDLHFSNFQNYCDHIHERDHSRNMKRTELPWRRQRESLDTRRTYDMMKSICAVVAHEVDPNFSLNRLSEILMPQSTDRRQIKDLGLERERGKFRDDDQLLHIRGYENLIPITGYFCQLCDRAFCDFVAIDQHVKSYEHNYRHTISVCTNAQSETNFRAQMDKSYRKLHPTANQVSGKAKTTPSSQALPSTPISINLPVASSSTVSDIPAIAPSSSAAATSTSTINPSSVTTSIASSSSNVPPVRYKKATSRIVDEHESIVDKFAPLSKSPGISSRSGRRTLESDEEDSPGSSDRHRLATSSSITAQTSKVLKRNRAPEIMALGESRSRPAALKRLRTERISRDLASDLTGNAAQVHRERSLSSSTSTSSHLHSDTDTDLESDEEIDKLGEAVNAANECEETDDEVEIICVGNPESPFPELNISMSGNLHKDIIKRKQLAKDCRVKMEKLDLDLYREMLMDKETVWVRVAMMETSKKECYHLNKLRKSLHSSLGKSEARLKRLAGKRPPTASSGGIPQVDSGKTRMGPSAELKQEAKKIMATGDGGDDNLSSGSSTPSESRQATKATTATATTSLSAKDKQQQQQPTTSSGSKLNSKSSSRVGANGKPLEDIKDSGDSAKDSIKGGLRYLESFFCESREHY